MRALSFILLFVLSVSALAGVEFFPRSRRYLYNQSDLFLKISSPKNIPSVKEYEQMRELLDEELRAKFPDYNQFIVNLLNENISKNILIHALDLLAKNHQLSPRDISSQSVKAFNLIVFFLNINAATPFNQKIDLIEQKIGVGKTKDFSLSGFSFGQLNLSISVKNKTFDKFLKLNQLENKVLFDSLDKEIIEKIFNLKNEYEVYSFLEYLSKRKSITILNGEPGFIEFLTSRVLQFSYDLLMEQIDSSVLANVKKQNRKKVLDEFIVKTASKHPFLSLFTDQSHLDVVANYLKVLPNSPLLKSNLRAKGYALRCTDNCQKLISQFEAEGPAFLNSLRGLRRFSFDKFPSTDVSKSLSSYFFNPLNELLKLNIAKLHKGEVYFLSKVEPLKAFEIPSSSKEYREVVNKEYQIQKLNNLLYLSLEDIFYQISFSHIIPSCVSEVCSDSLMTEDIAPLIFHEIVPGDDFKILKPKSFLGEVF